MHKLWKKNQIIITALVLLVGIAGYLNFTEKSISETWNWGQEEMEKESLTQEEADLMPKEQEAETDEETETDDEVGEAVLTSANSADNIFYAIKLNREQTRAENKEMLTEIINNVNATEKQKNEAIDSIIQMAEISEKENAAETLLSAKGFEGAVVSVEENNVDVVINQSSLSEQDIVQIEDIVKRKTGVTVENIIISTAKEKE